MLPPWKVRRVRQLLDKGYTHRRVHQLTGVSRVTIGRIGRNERPDYEARRHAEREEDAGELTGPVERCPECGYRVYLPCRICQARHAWARTRRRSRETRDDMGLCLRPHHQVRYEEVRVQRARRGPDHSDA